MVQMYQVDKVAYNLDPSNLRDTCILPIHDDIERYFYKYMLPYTGDQTYPLHKGLYNKTQYNQARIPIDPSQNDMNHNLKTIRFNQNLDIAYYHVYLSKLL